MEPREFRLMLQMAEALELADRPLFELFKQTGKAEHSAAFTAVDTALFNFKRYRDEEED